MYVYVRVRKSFILLKSRAKWVCTSAMGRESSGTRRIASWTGAGRSSGRRAASLSRSSFERYPHRAPPRRSHRQSLSFARLGYYGPRVTTLYFIYYNLEFISFDDSSGSRGSSKSKSAGLGIAASSSQSNISFSIVSRRRDFFRPHI